MVLLQKMATRRQHFSMLQCLFLLFCNFLVILHRNIVDFWCFCFRCTRTRFNYTQMFICYLSGPFSHLGDSVQFSCSVVPDSATRWNRSTPGLPVHHQLPEFTQTQCPLSWWCHPAISSSVPFSSCPQSFPASGSFPMSQFFTSGGVSVLEFQLQHQSFQWTPRTDLL